MPHHSAHHHAARHATQKALFFRAGPQHAASEVPVPCPPADAGAIQPRTFAGLLPGCDPEHLLLADVPLAEAAGRPVLLVYDQSSSAELNAAATRLTTNLRDGLEIRGDALAFYARPAADLGEFEWQQLDNAIYGVLTEFFGQGAAPSPADVQRLVAAFKAGRYDYRCREGEEGEDVNKDDAGEDLQDALVEP